MLYIRLENRNRWCSTGICSGVFVVCFIYQVRYNLMLIFLQMTPHYLKQMLRTQTVHDEKFKPTHDVTSSTIQLVIKEFSKWVKRECIPCAFQKYELRDFLNLCKEGVYLPQNTECVLALQKCILILFIITTFCKQCSSSSFSICLIRRSAVAQSVAREKILQSDVPGIVMNAVCVQTRRSDRQRRTKMQD